MGCKGVFRTSSNKKKISVFRETENENEKRNTLLGWGKGDHTYTNTDIIERYLYFLSKIVLDSSNMLFKKSKICEVVFKRKLFL